MSDSIVFEEKMAVRMCVGTDPRSEHLEASEGTGTCDEFEMKERK